MHASATEAKMNRLASWMFAGTLALGAGAALAHEHGAKVKYDELPSAVRTAFDQEAQGGGRIEELSKERKGDRTVYSGEVLKRGQGIDLQVGEDGSVLKRSPPHDEANERGGQ
jgi:hypothetical protein